MRRWLRGGGHTKLALALIFVVGLGIGGTAGIVLMPEGLYAGRVDALHHRWDGERKLDDGWAVQGSYWQISAGRRAAEHQVGQLDVLVSTPAPLPPLPGLAEAAGIAVVGDGIRSGRIICTNDWDCFFQGYRDAGGQYPEGRIDAMVQCESSWQLDPGGYHFGLAQFSPGTWATVSAITGLALPYNPYHHGYNGAVWSSIIFPGDDGRLAVLLVGVVTALGSGPTC